MRFSRRYRAGVSQEGVPTTCKEWILPVDAHQLLYTPTELVLVLILAHEARVANLSHKCPRISGLYTLVKRTGSRFEGIKPSSMEHKPLLEIDDIKQPAPAVVNAHVPSVVRSKGIRLSRGADSTLSQQNINVGTGVNQAPRDMASGSQPLLAKAVARAEPGTVEAPPSREYNLLCQSRWLQRKVTMTRPVMGYLKSWLKKRAKLSKFKTQWRQVRHCGLCTGVTFLKLECQCPVTTVATGAGEILRPFQEHLMMARPRGIRLLGGCVCGVRGY
jgi:hypothetical protein